ncbi:unnamed protein product [Meloidogyne enterolobii]|uniref:Uncharacterized protein n=1 Tax=Meloidogyne enterolobii TaxID=390850 RepID=A0ACB1B522_MELEN
MRIRVLLADSYFISLFILLGIFFSNFPFNSSIYFLNKGLTKNGCIIIKDNITSRDEERIFDECDNSWTRPSNELRLLIEAADLNIVLGRKQLFFPKNNFPVFMFVLKPSDII